MELLTVLGLFTVASCNAAARFELLLVFCLFCLLLDFGPILAENCFVPSSARTVDWQATGTDCVPLAHVELQTVLGPFTAAYCNAAARFELLMVFCLFWMVP